MFYYSFVILIYLAFVPKQSFALTLCSRDGLSTLLQCLLEEKHFINWSDILDQGIGCSKAGDCIAWQVWDRKVKLVKNYFECMKKVADIKATTWNNPDVMALLALEYKCRKDLADNLPEAYKSNYLPLLPELDNE